MEFNISTTMRLIQCLAGLHNKSSFGVVDDELAGFFNVSSGSEQWNIGTGATLWLREVIKSKLVPTICVLGIAGNLMTLIVLACQRLRSGVSAERKVTVWLQALAVSDLLLCVVLLPHGLMTYGDRLVHVSLSFQLLYQVYGTAIINNFILTSTWITVAMSFSRYLAVCHPLGAYQNVRMSTNSNSERCRHSGTRVAAAVIFVACFMFSLPRFFENRIESHSCVVGPNGAKQVRVKEVTLLPQFVHFIIKCFVTVTNIVLLCSTMYS